MKVRQFEIWIADLNPRRGTEAGKVRPVIVIQTDLLNKEHPSTIICPITTNVKPEAEILRVHLKKAKFGLIEDCDVMIDQIRAIDNNRLLEKIGEVDRATAEKVKANLRILMDLG
ncbi:type II toxin-antitoxin system PemK/MazF family toxin [Cognataquiflexum rubidum]|uniref:type II toxin-antitoxin system PemK/MazF family toxin n=1 Tax=Cognataquiflexum rubidum TaxID=2922273 RepID=UPI001F129DB9|nr:type II toxin-antitoxin system PemK/MazF family toxin [Cognataquiflexum rubidum]MCH6233652.1 type II toxin-antitoxin system PemK/MazF family toxin [Cognataquiflexum rubidum]